MCRVLKGLYMEGVKGTVCVMSSDSECKDGIAPGIY